jgi:serine/threonine protein kinase/tetratricopeptide (TPR) repeat protein
VNEHELFAAALEINVADERSAYLDRACDGDDHLRARIEALLRAHEQAGSFLVAPTVAGAAIVDAPKPMVEPGTAIGPYKLLQTIGEGGMGTVYMAEQTAPVRRLVALKVIKAGMDSRQVIARFEAERQALALMDHPNIARVLDGGATDAGRPYFVMELVRGVPVTVYCDQYRLTVRERLELFIPVCQAIQHAHQKGIIHRDIKPSNVLIAPYDGRPLPKVIDFGVAKATGPRLTDATLFTEFGAVLGTLEYMSPEQAQLNQLDVDTRSDIYALGVLLYELLTGTTPLQRERLRQTALLEVLRIIREEEPPKPSARLNTTEESPSIASNRGLEPRKLSGLVRGELDWIVMKALEKDRNRRYETAGSIAADVRRHLDDEPVQACPPSAWYRFRKFAGRNRPALAIAAAVALAVLVVVASIGWIVRDRAARRAKLNEGILFALHEAGMARDRALHSTSNRSEWQALLASAFTALEHAQELAGHDRAPEAAMRQRLDGLRVRLESDETDRRFVACLDELLVQIIVWNAHRSLSRGEAAFFKIADAFKRFYGVELGSTPMEDAARRLQQRPAPIQGHVLAALHVGLALAPKGSPLVHRWLGHVLELADGDPWRKQARQALENEDWRHLEKALKEVAVDKHPPVLVHLLASYLPQDAWVTKMDVFLQMERSYPGELWASRFGNALTCNLFAWVLVTTSDPEIRDEKRGLELATLSVRLAPRDSDFWNTLGVALYRVGNWREAVSAFQRSMELGKGGDVMDWLFLAMSHWQLGHKDEACKWYNQAAVEAPPSRLLEGILPRVRAEAAELLGVKQDKQ